MIWYILYDVIWRDNIYCIWYDICYDIYHVIYDMIYIMWYMIWYMIWYIIYHVIYHKIYDIYYMMWYDVIIYIAYMIYVMIYIMWYIWYIIYHVIYDMMWYDTGAYLHRFKILEHATCPCSNGDQTIDHLIYQCSILHTQREILISNILKSRNWPVKKQDLISKYAKPFLMFIKSINFDLLWLILVYFEYFDLL
jgi:hypothetical protein